MFGRNKVQIAPELYQKAKRLAKERGFSSVEEFIEDLLEKEVEKSNKGNKDDEEKVKERLRGLGYIS